MKPESRWLDVDVFCMNFAFLTHDVPVESSVRDNLYV